MDSGQHDEQAPAGSAEISRSDRSREFERFWRGLPKKGLVPHRRDVQPARAASLLRDIVMLEIRLGDAPSLRIRLTGSAIQERVQKDIRGLDYLDFRPAEYRTETIDVVRLMTSQPCGLWQVMPMHYARGFAQNFEFTAFPLIGEETPLIIGLMQPLGGLVQPMTLDDQPILAAQFSALEFIDIGAGKAALTTYAQY